MTVRPPNIVLILADNLGWGELGCYGGGVLRGSPTPRIDALSEEGLTCLNFNVESDCVPTRSALMTGRHPIRTGAMQSVPAGLPQGLIPWEITIGELLQGAGYATACFGKWHLGDREGRLPKDRGFDEWYGIPRTSNEAMFTAAPGFDPTIVPMPYVMEGVKGAPAQNLAVYDLEQRRLIDGELTRRTIDFMERQSAAARPFFAYVPLTQLHFPTLPHPDFAGRTGAGDFADAMAEMDHRVGEILDAIERLGLREDTLVLFGSDNGPEFRRPWRGTAGSMAGDLPHRHGRWASRTFHPALARPHRAAPHDGCAAHHRSVSDAGEARRCQPAGRPRHRRHRPARLLPGRTAEVGPRRVSLLHQDRASGRQMARLEDASHVGGRTQ